MDLEENHIVTLVNFNRRLVLDAKYWTNINFTYVISYLLL